MVVRLPGLFVASSHFIAFFSFLVRFHGSMFPVAGGAHCIGHLAVPCLVEGEAIEDMPNIEIFWTILEVLDISQFYIFILFGK